MLTLMFLSGQVTRSMHAGVFLGARIVVQHKEVKMFKLLGFEGTKNNFLMRPILRVPQEAQKLLS